MAGDTSGRFHWMDYLIFGSTLVISIIIGIYHAFRKGGQHTTKDFLLGGREMPIIPTALSLLVSFLSGILLLGISSEMYMKGPQMIWFLLGIIFAIPMAAVVYQPIFYKLQLTSAFEYLELRYRSKLLRLVGSIFFMASALMYTAIVLYAPATALAIVSGVKLEILIVVSGVACTFYTTIGGLKAVVWTDAFQAVIMYVGLLAVVIQGLIEVGGVSEFWRRANEGGRIFTSFDPNPFQYMNFWIIVIGTAFGWMSTYGLSQVSIQRYTSLSTLRKAQWSLMLVLPGMLTMFPLVLLAGLIMYTYYWQCDPLTLGTVDNRDQLMPYFTVDILGHVKGLPGVFLACLYSGTLSTVSSNLNSIAAVVWEDFLKPFLGRRCSENTATIINKCTALFFGIVGIGLACTAKHLGGVFQAAMTVLQILGGPTGGLFLFGILFPWAEWIGALCGVIFSSAIMGWICAGAQIIKPYRVSLPRTIAGCSNSTLDAAGKLFTTTIASATTTLAPQDVELTGYKIIYKLSYQLYGLTAILLVFVVGVPISLLVTRGKLDDRDVPLVWSGVRWMMCCVSKRWRKMWKIHEKEFKAQGKTRPMVKPAGPYVHPKMEEAEKGFADITFSKSTVVEKKDDTTRL